MNKLFIYSLNKKVSEVKPGIIQLLKTIKRESVGNLFGDITIITSYVLPKLNTLAAIEVQLSELNKQYAALQTENATLEKDFSDKVAEISGYKEKIDKVTQNIKKVQADLIAKDNIISDLNSQYATLSNKYQTLSEENVKLLSEREQLITTINSLLSESKLEFKRLNKLGDLHDLISNILTHLNDSTKYEENLFNLVKDIINEMANKLPNVRLKNEITTLEDVKMALSQINRGLETKINSINDVFKKYTKLFSDNLVFEGKLSKLDEVLQDYEQCKVKVNTLISDIENKTNQINDLNKNIANLTNNYNEIVAYRTMVIKKQNDLVTEINSLIASNVTINSVAKLTTIGDILKTISDICDKYQSKIKTLELSIDNINNINDKKSNNENSLRVEIETLKSKLKECKIEKNDIDKNIILKLNNLFDYLYTNLLSIKYNKEIKNIEDIKIVIDNCILPLDKRNKLFTSALLTYNQLFDNIDDTETTVNITKEVFKEYLLYKDFLINLKKIIK